MAAPPGPTTVASRDRSEEYVLAIVGDRSFRCSLDKLTRCVMGRSPECELHLDDDSVSRRHAQLDLGPGGAVLRDLGSHNGTRLNGAAVTEPRQVVSGDVVTLGDSTVILYLERARPARTVSTADVVARLEAEVARALRFGRALTVAVWEVAAADRYLELLGPSLRGCEAVGLAAGGVIAGVFPELDSGAVEEVVREGLELLHVSSTDARAGIAVCPADGGDATTLLAAARDAARAAVDGVGRAEQAVRRVEVGERTVLLADPGMVRAYELLRRLAASDLPVLVNGETGVGKELAAQAIHGWSRRARRPFVAVNCAAIPENLVESELFGHAKGAFTGADEARPGLLTRASGGTLFLDEIGDLPLAAQAKLLRALEQSSVTPVGARASLTIDVRFVAATHRDLAAEVAAGRFRQDLYYRLNGAVVVLPPLRDRPREIPVLARAFVAAACARLGRPALSLADATLRQLEGRRFEGNVRELAHAMEYAVAVAGDVDAVQPWHLPTELTSSPAHAPAHRVFRPIAEEVAELEKRRMQEALEAARYNQSRAADLIEMPRRTFVTKLGKYGIR